MKRVWAFLTGSKEEASSAKRRKPAEPAPSLAEASQTIDAKTKGLELKIQRCDAEIRDLAGSKVPTAKKRAIQAMQRRKMLEQQRDTLIGQQFNIDNLALAQDQADINAMAVDVMAAGQEALAAQKVDIGHVEQVVDNLQEQMDELKEVNTLLASNVMQGADEDQGDMEAEFARMQAEAAEASLLDASLASAAAPASTAASSVGPAPVANAPTIPAPSAVAAGARIAPAVAPAFAPAVSPALAPAVAPAVALQTHAPS